MNAKEKLQLNFVYNLRVVVDVLNFILNQRCNKSSFEIHHSFTCLGDPLQNWKQYLVKIECYGIMDKFKQQNIFPIKYIRIIRSIYQNQVLDKISQSSVSEYE